MSSTPPTAAEGASLFFTDARACKAWLAGLAVSNVAQTLSSVLDALRVFNRASFDPLERLKSLELVRDRVGFMMTELRTRVFARALPHGAGDVAAWDVARLVLEEMEGGYRRAFAEPQLAEHAALVTQRMIRYVAAQMVLHGVVYRDFDAALWTRLHQAYEGAERAGYAEDKVKDSLEAEGGVSSVAEAYAQAVLLDAAGFHEMTPAQTQFAESLVKLWARKLKVSLQAPDEAPAVLPMVVDLTASAGAGPVRADSLSGSHRVISVEEICRSIRRRIRVLQAGEEGTTLGLPAAALGVDLATTLPRLAKCWCEPAGPESALEPVPGKPAGLVSGLNEAHFFLSGGKAFEQPGKERDLTTQEKNDIAVFGRITERTQTLIAATASPNAPGYTVDPWETVGEGLGLVRIRRKTAGSRTAAIGRIVAVRMGEAGAAFQLGVIRALYNQGTAIEAVVALYPGRPTPAAVRSANSPWAQAIGLPALEKIGVPATLIVPAAMGSRGRSLQVREGEETREAKVQDVLEREADFSRIVAA
jgi:hypothetical protein